MLRIPLLEWCFIPPGDGIIIFEHNEGVVNGVFQYRREERPFSVEAFHISKYPVTIGQYRLFVEASDGYCCPDWWNYSPFAQEWRQNHPQPNLSFYEHYLIKHPSVQKSSVSKRLPPPPADILEEHPQEQVCWYDAMAFCRWLSNQMQLSITLPTEQEWQRSAQGDHQSIFPWGDHFEIDRCNCADSITGGRATTPVTRFPGGASSFGVVDMAGNVEEWCLTDYDSGRHDDLTTDTTRVYRGGSFNLGQKGLHMNNRGGALPDYEIGLVGFRLVMHGAESSSL